MIKLPKKLIEVALPLDDINQASVREKSIRHGHPSTLHLWWARRPLATARAVLFAQMVNDPGYERSLGRGINKEKAQSERERLFGILRKLVQWENTTNEDVLNEAREEIKKSWRETCALNKDHPQAKELFDPDKLPPFHDPFAGGGAIPLEAQRLGLESWASDLNPVAVLINKAMIEIPPKFAERKPVGPAPKGEQKGRTTEPDWSGAQGLAEDVRRYGHWMREEAEKRIGHLYPKIEITKEMAKDSPDLVPLVGQKLTVIAWLWARTVKSPNPAYHHVDVPLVSSFYLSTKKGKEAWVEPVVEGDQYRFVVKVGKLPEKIGIGGCPPPTPPGMRGRTGRFEKLRLKEPGHTQAVEIRDCEHLVESRLTVMPPALDSTCRHNGQLMGRTHLENLTVYRSAAFPVLELNRPKSVANPRIEVSERPWRLGQMKVGLPSRQIQPQLPGHLF